MTIGSSSGKVRGRPATRSSRSSSGRVRREVDSEWAEVVLSSADARDEDLLVEPRARSLGPEADIVARRIVVRMGRRPVAIDLRRHGAASRRQKALLELVSGERDFWLIVFGVGAVKTGGWARIVGLGCRVDFDSAARVTIHQLLPATEFIKKLGGRWTFAATLGADGSAEAQRTAGSDHAIKIDAHGALKVRSEGEVTGTFSFSAMTPLIQAIGVGDHVAQWELRKAEKPLLGDQVLAAVISCPRGTAEIGLTAEVSVIISSWWGVSGTRLVKTSIPITCSLKDAAPAE